MSRKGNCLDNSMMENFFGLMKSELLYSQKWNTLADFEDALVDYIEYHNNERIKLRLDGMSPAQYRTRQVFESIVINSSNFLGSPQLYG
ncbi:MAG: IS3 family transposase [Bacteroidales bacterium]|nr:IS3 family transposase [Bacteroidales bacterium]